MRTQAPGLDTELIWSVSGATIQRARRDSPPGRGEEEDEDGDECNLGIDGSDVLSDRLAGGVGGELVEADGHSDDGHEELTNQHTKGTKDEERATSEALHGIERDGSGANVDNSEDHRNQEGIVDGSGRPISSFFFL